MAKFDPEPTLNPLQIVTKIEAHDYVADIYYQKITPPRCFCPIPSVFLSEINGKQISGINSDHLAIPTMYALGWGR